MRGDVDDVDDLDAPSAPRVEDAPAGGPAPRGRRRRRRTWAVAAAVAVLLVIGGTALQRASSDDDAPAPLDGSASASELFPVLADAASAVALPDASLATALRLVPGSAHRLATVPAATIWIAQDEDGGVCLVVQELTSGSSGGSCAAAADVAVVPLVLPAGTGVSAALAPRGQDTAPLVADGYAELGSGRSKGLWVDGATADGIVEAAVDGTATRIVVVPSESHRGSAALPAVTTEDAEPYAVVLACLQQSVVVVSVDDAAAEETDCGGGSIARHLTGTGAQVQVRVEAPAGLVWAASVVACTGPLADPVC